MNASLTRNPFVLGFIALLVLIILGSTFAVVPETRQAVIVRFGEVDRVINPYRPGAPFGQTRRVPEPAIAAPAAPAQGAVQ